MRKPAVCTRFASVPLAARRTDLGAGPRIEVYPAGSGPYPRLRLASSQACGMVTAARAPVAGPSVSVQTNNSFKPRPLRGLGVAPWYCCTRLGRVRGPA